MRAGGAGGCGRFVRAFCPETHGDVSGGKVDDGSRDEEGRYFAGTAVEEVRVFSLNDVEPADAGTDVDADALLVLRCDFQARTLHRFFAGRQGEVDEPGHLFEFFFFNESEGVEVLDLGGNLTSETSGVELCDAGDAALSCQQVPPDFFGAVAYCADESEPGDNDPSCQTTCFLSRAYRCSRRHPARCGSFRHPRREFRCRKPPRRPLPAPRYRANRRPDRPRTRHWGSLRLRPRPTAPR